MFVKMLKRDWEWHGQRCGYESIGNFVDKKQIVQPLNRVKIPYRVAKFFSKRIKQTGYTSLSFTREMAAIRDCVKERPDIMHVLYGEYDYYYLGKIKKLFPKTKIIATFHQPPLELERRLSSLSKKIFQRLDGAVCLGRNQIPYIENFIGKGKSIFIPHGVDTNFFSPSSNQRDSKHLLIIGIMHRDFETLIEVLKGIKKKIPELACTVTMQETHDNRKDVRKIKSMQWINFLGRIISDEELLEYYRKVTCTLLLLKDAVASNVLLETAAAGCPLVVTRVGAVEDYTDEDSCYFIDKGDTENIVKCIGEAINNKELSMRKSVNARDKILSFDWRKIIERLQDYYKVIYEGAV